jgi:hypothetical protein
VNLLQRYACFWDRREPAQSLALVRIGVGATLLLDLTQIAGLGLVRALFAPIEDGGIGPASYAHPRVLFYEAFGASAATAYLLFGLTMCSALALCVGFHTRLSALLLLFCSAQLSALAPDADRGIDGLLRNALAVLALSGAGATWSLDARWETGSFAPQREVPAWPRYLLIAQVVLLYFSAGVLKQSAAWSAVGGYSALFMVLSKPLYTRFEWSHWQLVALYPLLQMATFATLAFERSALFVPLWMWLRANPERGGLVGKLVRRGHVLEIWIATGVMFHLGLAAFTELGIFPWGCLALYPALLRPERVQAGIDLLRRRSAS